MAACHQERSQVGGPVRGLSALAGKSIPQCGKFSIADQIRNVEIDLGENPFDLSFGEIIS